MLKNAGIKNSDLKNPEFCKSIIKDCVDVVSQFEDTNNNQSSKYETIAKNFVKNPDIIEKIYGDNIKKDIIKNIEV